MEKGKEERLIALIVIRRILKSLSSPFFSTYPPSFYPRRDIQRCATDGHQSEGGPASDRSGIQQFRLAHFLWRATGRDSVKIFKEPCGEFLLFICFVW